MYWTVSGNPRPMVSTFDVFGIQENQDFVNGSASLIRAAFNQSFKTLYPATVVLSRVVVSTPLAEDLETTPLAGTHNAFALAPPQVTHLVTKVGGIRKRQGRLYLPAVNENDVDDLGNLPAGYVSSWNTQLASFLSYLSSNGLPMMQRQTDADGTATRPVTQLVMKNRVATQRRRMKVK